MLAFSPRIWLALLLVIAWVVWRRLRARPDTPPATDHQSTDSDLFGEIHAHFEEQQLALEQARHWSDDEVGLEVERYLFKVPHSSEGHDLLDRLAQRPQTAAEQARRTLLDPAMQTRLHKRAGDETPWLRACMLLDLWPDIGNAPFVRRLLTDPTATVRHEAWHWLARIGCDDDVAELVRGIATPPDDATRSWILIGLAWADGQGRLSGQARESLFEPLLEHLNGYDTREVPGLLLRWDRERALSSLDARGMLTPEHPEFGYVAQAMAGRGLSLPRDLLLELLTRGSDPYSPSTFRSFGTMLGSLRQPEDESTLRRLLDEGGDVAEAAAAGLQTYYGVEAWSDHLAARRGQWTDTERRLDAMRWVENEVCSGGFAQYFLHSASATWADALAGFAAAGDAHREGLLRKAVERFPAEPDPDRDRRGRQLAEVEAADAAAFEQLDRRYLGPRTDIDVVLTRYMLANLEELSARW